MSALFGWFFVVGTALVVAFSIAKVGRRRALQDAATYAMLAIGLLSLRDGLRLEDNSLPSWTLRAGAFCLLVYAYLVRRRPSVPGAA